MHLNLTEHLNAEIVLSVVTNLENAMFWAQSTYMHVRMVKDPQKYGVMNGVSVEQFIRGMVRDIIQRLIAVEFVHFTETQQLVSTSYGAIASRFYIRFATMKRFMAIPNSASASILLQTLAKAEEFEDVKFAPGDKGIINQILKDQKVRFKETTGKIKEVWEKIFYSIQVSRSIIMFAKRSYVDGTWRC